MPSTRDKRPSPSDSATKFAVGTVRTGNDGGWWVIKESATKVRRWVKVASPAAKTSKSKSLAAKTSKSKTPAAKTSVPVARSKPPAAKTSKTSKTSTSKSKDATGELTFVALPKLPASRLAGDRLVKFCEPMTQIDSKMGIEFRVTAAFLGALRRRPKSYANRAAAGNAYVFGRLRPIATYACLGGCGNDAAQIGLVDVTGLDRKGRKELAGAADEKFELCYIMGGGTRRRKLTDWDDRDCLRRLRLELSPRILFVGETFGGDVGADLLVHLAPSGAVDGLIIDNNCFVTSELIPGSAPRLV